VADVLKPAKDAYIRECATERYEMAAGPAYQFDLTRRDVCRLLGGGFLLVLLDPGTAAGQVSGAGAAQAPGKRISARIHIDGQGVITLLTGKIEMGQGAATMLTQAAAEELRVSPPRVRLVMGDTALTPDDGGTWASLTTPESVPLIRRASAVARTTLGELASRHLQVPSSALAFDDGVIRSASGSTVAYWELVEQAAPAANSPEQAELTAPADWKVLGTSLPPVFGREIVTGALRYSSDLAVPGMWHGAMVRSPYYHSKLASHEAAPAEALGAKVVREGNFLGVVAPDAAQASKAARAVKATWTQEPLPALEEVYEQFVSRAEAPKLGQGGRYPALVEKGNVAEALEKAAKRHQSRYLVPPIAHVPLEPRSAVASWEGDKLTVWCGNQAPFLVRNELAEAFKLPVDSVRVISTPVGGGFGGKQRCEAAVEAARLAKSAGRPVKVAWDRQEEFWWSYTRPAGVLTVNSGLDASGRIAAWDFRNYNSGSAGLPISYDIPHLHCGFYRSGSPLRQGSYRSLAAMANNFARESHMDELAEVAGVDPLEFRLRHIPSARWKETVEQAAERFGWGSFKPGNGHGAGMCLNLEKDAYLACFLSLTVRDAKARVERIVLAMDCGAVLNPDNLRNQGEGGLIMGLGGALFEQLRFDARGLVNARMSRYRVPRFSDTPPQVDVILIDRRNEPSTGAGEAPITMVASAIAGAVWQATGRRIRQLPIEPALSLGAPAT
jgi:nicotinate dehydrogenase subunit B